jgi:hypothetical protein
MTEPTSRPLTPLMGFLAACSVLGLVSVWGFWAQFYVENGRPIGVIEWFTAGFRVSPLLSNITADFLVGAVPAQIWMAVEARRLGMRWWAWLLATIGLSFACGFPWFLYARERELQRRAALVPQLPDHPIGSPAGPAG